MPGAVEDEGEGVEVVTKTDNGLTIHIPTKVKQIEKRTRDMRTPLIIYQSVMFILEVLVAVAMIIVGFTTRCNASSHINLFFKVAGAVMLVTFALRILTSWYLRPKLNRGAFIRQTKKKLYTLALAVVMVGYLINAALAMVGIVIGLSIGWPNMWESSDKEFCSPIAFALLILYLVVFFSDLILIFCCVAVPCLMGSACFPVLLGVVCCLLLANEPDSEDEQQVEMDEGIREEREEEEAPY